MFYRYEIKNNGKEDVLYLYLTMTYEFSKELDMNNDNSSIMKKTNDFINNNSIDFKGNKVYLVVDGIIIKSFDISKEYVIRDIPNNLKYSNKNFMINVKYSKNKIESISLENYLLGVIATNKIIDLELTTLKAVCLLYRTYAYKQMKEKNYIDAINEYQIYKPISYFKVIWMDKFKDNYNMIKKAIDDTDGEFITYNDEYIYPFIHISNNGFTKDSLKYKYLTKKISIWDYASPHYLEIKDYSYEDLKRLFGIKEDDIKTLQILKINPSNQIEKIKIGSKEYSGDYFRTLLNLKSTDINIIINPKSVKFITKGWGNQLGLSLFGANEIAKAGCSYTGILNYYFNDIKIKKYK